MLKKVDWMIYLKKIFDNDLRLDEEWTQTYILIFNIKIYNNKQITVELKGLGSVWYDQQSISTGKIKY